MRLIALLSILCVNLSLFAQNAIVSGFVKDKKTQEPLPGVNIILQDKSGGITNANGNFSIKVNKPGKQSISFIYIGYKTVSQNIEVSLNDKISLNIEMEEDIKVMDEVVVSAAKFEQKLSEVTISMEVIKPKLLENNNITSMDRAVNQLPGVDVMDQQPSIRGGSGYSYGAGSRVLLLVDDMPMLSPDAGDIKWDFLPVENISQVEVVKGAASALFGSSALNGVINVRTNFPKDEPETKITIFNGLYMNPARKELIWWGTAQPLFMGTNILHMQKIKNLDVVIGANAFSDNGYREKATEEHLRTNFNLRYRVPKVKGLSVGLNGNFMNLDKTEFFLWQNADSGAYKQRADAINRNVGTRINVDPYVTYFSSDRNKHTFRSRYFYVKNRVPGDTAKSSNSNLYYFEYQFQHQIKENFTMTVGCLNSYSDIKGSLFKRHNATNISIFGQFDKKIKKLNLSAGIRAEYFRIDKDETKTVIGKDTIKDIPIQPVMRVGASYQLAKYTFLRTSFGQGYRFPSIAEKYTYTSVSALNIFPNPDIKPETGWSSELGIKQGIKISGWNGYVDVSGFWTEYHEMMEYTFGVYNPQTYKILDPNNSNDIAVIMSNGLFKCVGFQSQNIGNARITGFDMTFTGTGNFFGIPATLIAGYTYTNPIDLNVKVNDSTRTTKTNILKYRYYHSVKGDFQLDFKKISTGISVMYQSNMINIDKAFEKPLIDNSTIYLLPGLKEYREKHNKGYIVFDYRVTWNLNEQSKLSLVVKNIFNKEYMGRPGDIQPPRNVSLQYILSL
jgi:iron complex outermembrane receptor protein